MQFLVTIWPTYISTVLYLHWALLFAVKEKQCMIFSIKMWRQLLLYTSLIEKLNYRKNFMSQVPSRSYLPSAYSQPRWLVGAVLPFHDGRTTLRQTRVSSSHGEDVMMLKSTTTLRAWLIVRQLANHVTALPLCAWWNVNMDLNKTKMAVTCASAKVVWNRMTKIVCSTNNNV